LDEPDFTTASRLVSSIRRIGLEALALDAATITVPISDDDDIVELVSRIESLTIVPDVVAKIVVNERTGTIVIGENVKISPVAVSYAGIDVSIGNVSLFSEGYTQDSVLDESYYLARSNAQLKKTEGKLTLVEGGATLSTLVRGLNTIGATPKDLIAILQAMKRAGAIKAELEVI